MGKQIHQLTLTREDPKKPFGFRIIGGKDEGQTFKVKYQVCDLFATLK